MYKIISWSGVDTRGDKPRTEAIRAAIQMKFIAQIVRENSIELSL
jgi:hypothetical protein